MLERLLFRKIEVWVLIAVILVGTIAVMMFGWAIHDRGKGGETGGVFVDLLVRVAKIPDPLMQFLLSEGNVFQPQIFTFDEFAEFQDYDPDFIDTGILLVSSFSAENGVSTAYLYDLEKQKRLFEWIPPVEEINARSSIKGAIQLKENYKTQHPLLLDDGDLVFTSGSGPLVRIDKCGNLKWVIDRNFHHAITVASNGNIFVPSVIESSTDQPDAASGNTSVSPLTDDSIVEVSPDGTVINEWSVTEILERHGYDGLLYGVGAYEVDRIHLNDIEPMLQSDGYVQEGDLALSIRNLSTVMMYRPSTDEILWLQTGPWLNQHDVDYQGNGIYTIFGNDRIRGAADDQSLRGYSTIWVYNQKDGSTEPFLELDEVNIFTNTQGLHRVLPNGDVFVEETKKNILHRVNGTKLRWSYVNSIGEGKVGALHWSRYIYRGEHQLDWIESASCS